LRDGVKKARSIVEDGLMALVVKEEIFPGANYSTDEQIEEHVYQHIFGHHACCTAKMGADDGEWRFTT
jgi:choline dehydrogenase